MLFEKSFEVKTLKSIVAIDNYKSSYVSRLCLHIVDAVLLHFCSQFLCAVRCFVEFFRNVLKTPFFRYV